MSDEWLITFSVFSTVITVLTKSKPFFLPRNNRTDIWGYYMIIVTVTKKKGNSFHLSYVDQKIGRKKKNTTGKKKNKTYPVIKYTKDSWRKWEGGGLFNRLRVNMKGISLCWQGTFEAMSTQTVQHSSLKIVSAVQHWPETLHVPLSRL